MFQIDKQRNDNLDAMIRKPARRLTLSSSKQFTRVKLSRSRQRRDNFTYSDSLSVDNSSPASYDKRISLNIGVDASFT